MRSRVSAGVVVVASVALFAACGSDNDTTTPTVTSTTYISTMNGANEPPPPVRVTNATGTATYVRTGSRVTFTISATGLTAPVTAAHIHVGAAGVNGGVIVPYTINPGVTTGVVTSGTIDLSLPIVNGATSITGDSLMKLFDAGLAYTNVHTSTYAGGEIRGQITKQP